MITEDEATRLLRRADPARFEARVPVVDAAGYLADLRTRSTTVTLTQTQPTDTNPGGRHRWPIIALAAAAVVLILVGALVLAARDDDTTVPADTTLAPEQPANAADVVQGYITALTTFDADSALTYLADDVVASRYKSADAFRRGMAWDHAARFTPSFGECTPREPGIEGEATFACSQVVHGLGSDVLGNGGYRRPDLLLTVRDGKIVDESQADADWVSAGIDVIGPFTDWIHAAHPEDLAVMYREDGDTPSWELSTDEALLVWKQRTDEFVQFVLDAREAFHADVAAVCATQADELARLAAPSDESADQLATWTAAVAVILQQSHQELTALTKPIATDNAAYFSFYGKLITLVHNLEDSAQALTGAGSTQQDELRAEYLDIRSAMSSGPAGSGLEECLSSLPT